MVHFRYQVFMFQCYLSILWNTWFVTAQKSQCKENIEVNSEVGRIQSPGYPDPYRSGCEWTYTINVGEYGSEIEIIMESFDIDQAAGDSLYVATGTIEDNRNWYKIEKSDLEVYVRSPAILKFVTTQHLINTHTGFSIVFRKHDDIDNFGTTSRKTTLATDDNEIVSYNNWLIIQLKEMSMAEFERKKECFQKAMANVTSIYSAEYSLNISQILHDMGYEQLILINSVDNCKQCFIYKENCLQINISINSNAIGFKEINQIWNLYKHSYMFRSIGIQEHTNSDNEMDGLIMTWLVASIFLAIVVVALLVVLMRNKRITSYVTWFQVKARTDSKDENIWFQSKSGHEGEFQPYLPTYSEYVCSKNNTRKKSRATEEEFGLNNDEIDFDSMLYSLETYKPDRSFRYLSPDVHLRSSPIPIPINSNPTRTELPNEKLRRYQTKEFF